MRLARFVISGFVCLISVADLSAQESIDEEGWIPPREVSGYEPSYFLFADDDDDHLEFKVSIKYPLVDDRTGLINRYVSGDNKIYFAYTGKYDFFLFSKGDSSRESAPIVSRLQNPGLFYKNSKCDAYNCPGVGLESFTVGWFHESNGQQIDDRKTFLATKHAEDFVSRGWDYLAVDFKFKEKSQLISSGIVNYYLKFRAYCNCQGFGLLDKEDDLSIFGIPDQFGIGDFDGVRLQVNNYVKKNLRLGFQARTGIENPFDKLSYQFEVIYHGWLNIPLKITYFTGYGKDISTYHIKDEYLGIGIEIW